MTEKSTPDKFPLTLDLPAEVAKRLAIAAEAQKRSPAALAIEVLDRNLPRLKSGPAKGKIPYT